MSEEIKRLKEVLEKCGDDWPKEFDPNDISLYEIVQKEFEGQEVAGVEIRDWDSKPLLFFVRLMREYVTQTKFESTEEWQSLSVIVEQMARQVPPGHLKL
ncbi:MAG TPA: hypothetical protein VH105_03870 [Burkholderiales bacterium]|nr:hypothetical protein [Burkholderiales bacterium]